ncbi:MAG: helix-turn-helix domain-containing protein [Acidobacteria bacterium]|nr:helix-turn-helix domain-containing protein [Acidobacteriota bacterium]
MTRRDWWFGVGVIVLALLFHASVPRYEWRVVSNGIVVRIDRWSGVADASVVNRDGWSDVPYSFGGRFVAVQDPWLTALDSVQQPLMWWRLGTIAIRPDLTSQEGIRAALGVARPVVAASLARLVTQGWVLPPDKQRHPYVVTTSGQAALTEAAA